MPLALSIVLMGVERFSPLACVVLMILPLRSISTKPGMFQFHGAAVRQSPSGVHTLAVAAAQRIESDPFRLSAFASGLTAIASASEIPKKQIPLSICGLLSIDLCWPVRSAHIIVCLNVRSWTAEMDTQQRRKPDAH